MTIINSRKPQTMEVINKLESSPIEFYLTGSRFFGTYGERSDWDFFTQDCSNTHEFLKKLGFVETSGSTYRTDPLIATVYIHKDTDIHVQVVKDAKLKNAIQKRLREVADLYPDLVPLGDKSVMKKIWKLLIEVCKIFSPCPENIS